MSRYIDADALQKLFNEVSTSLLCRRELTKDIEHMVRAFIMVTEMIQDAPTVDVVEVVHAYWDDTGRYRFEDGSIAVRCSNCGCSITEKEYQKFVWNGCPVCLAKMDGERRNDG